MKHVNAVLTIVLFAATLAMPTILGRTSRELKWWIFSAMAILSLGWLLAAHDRDALPEAEAKRLRGRGFVNGVTGAHSLRSARIFCAALVAWLVAAGVRACVQHYT